MTSSNQQTSSKPPLITPLGIILVFILLGANVGLVLALWRPHQPAQPPETTTELPAETRPPIPVINAHEHLYRIDHLPNYLNAAQTMGIEQTIFVASSSATFLGDQGEQDELYDWNTGEILAAAQKYPGKIIPFCTIHPADPQKLEKLQQYVAQGAKGLKLYTGHSNFHNLPLDHADMAPIYEYCQRINLPIVWHIRLGRFESEFRNVMDQFPNLTVIIPHFGVTFYRPISEFSRLPQLFRDYPNVYVDTSFGTRSILVHGLEMVSANVDIFRTFFLEQADRIVFGTDMVVTGNNEKTEQWCEAVIRACRDVLEKDRYHFYMAARGSPYAYARANNIYGELRGLNLPHHVLQKVYQTNIQHILNALDTEHE